MKIAIITSQYPSKGIPYNHMFVHMRSKEMVSNKENVVVYVPSNKVKKYLIDGVSVKKMNSASIINELQDFEVIYLHLLNLYPFLQKDGWKIYDFIIKKNCPFAMYIHGSEVLRYKARKFGFEFSFNDLLSWIRKDFYSLPRIRMFISKSIQNPNCKFITNSKWMAKEAERNLNISIEKNISIIPNGIDTKIFSYRKNNNLKKLVTIRPLGDKVYNIEKSIQVMKYLPDEYTLDIYGKGKFLRQYQNLINKEMLSDRVKIFNRFIERDEMNDLFSKYGIFISTTRMDSQGVTMLEAMSSGLLTVSTNNSSKPEFIKDMKTGVLGISAQELAKKILTVTKNKSVYYTIAKNGSDSIKEIDLKKTILKELEILKFLSNL